MTKTILTFRPRLVMFTTEAGLQALYMLSVFISQTPNLDSLSEGVLCYSLGERDDLGDIWIDELLESLGHFCGF